MKNKKKNTIIFSFLVSTSFLFSDPTIIQPGAPGEASKTLDPQAASNIADTSYIKADVKFLQGMIIHHQQAVLMSSMADKRTNNKTIVDLAKRIDVSQEDEINFMESWLYDRGENTNMPHHNMDMGMAGMATPKQLEGLKNTKATDFDRLFLQLMIAHHDGALKMVKELREFSGSAYDPILSEFVSDLVNDQGVEIERMNTIAVNLSDDPRSGLTPGLYIADEAIMNLELVASLKKPIGFFDPNNPEGKRPEDPGKEKDEDEEVSILEASKSLLRQC